MTSQTAATGSKVFTVQRREQIARMLDERDSLTTEELAAQFGVSHMTVYRDLKSLEAQGVLRRVHGGAIKGDGNAVEPIFASKQVENIEKKEKIARYAANHFVNNGDVVIIEGGTTSVAMLKYLDCQQLTIITNGLETIKEAASLSPALTVLCCGGILRRGSNTFVGPTAEEFFRHNRARTFFISASGLVIPEGITDPNPLEIQVKRAMAGGAERVILLLDSSKMGKRSLSPILPLERIEYLVTDTELTTDYYQKIRELGLDVHIAD